MPQLPVVVVHLFLCSWFAVMGITFMIRNAVFLMVCFVVSVLTSASVTAAPVTVDGNVSAGRYVADFEVHTAKELHFALQRAEQYLSEKTVPGEAAKPVAFVLHGAEAGVFLKENYKSNRAVADLAARLSALNLVDIKVCRVWMGGQSIKEDELLPFIDTVDYWRDEVKRLEQKEGYVSF